MKINWKVRFKNKVFLTSFIGCIVTFIFSMLSVLDIYPNVTQNTVTQAINALLTMLSMMGVITDPTTAGVDDSARAMGYDTPWVDPVPEAKPPEDGGDLG